MTSAEPVGGPGTPEPDLSPRRVPPASGIYGLIVAASVLAAAGADLPTGPLALAVFGTLVVYWLAEEYAGGRTRQRRSSAELGSYSCGAESKVANRECLTFRWSHSLIARLFGAGPSTAALIALVVIVALLIVYGWRAGRASGLHGLPLVVVTSPPADWDCS